MSSLIHERHYQKLLGDITGLCENARSVLVETYWQIGKRIVEEEQAGNVNADHGTQLIERLAEDLTANLGSGFSKANVYNFRRFYLTHKSFQPAGNLSWSQYVELLPVKDDSLRTKLEKEVQQKSLSKREIKTLVKEQIVMAKPEPTAPETVEAIPILPCKRDGLFHSYLALNRERVAHPKGCVVVDFGFNIWRAIPKDSYAKVNEPAYTYSARVESVIDGDTIWTIIDLGFGTLSRQKLRLNYIDTPELGTAPGEKASRYVRRILKATPNIVICTHKHDKYTRYLADVFYLPGARSPKRILQEGIYLNQELLDKSLATVF